MTSNMLLIEQDNIPGPIDIQAQVQEGNPVLKLIMQEVQAVRAELGDEPKFMTEADKALREAKVIHNVTLRIEDMENTAVLAYRYVLWLVLRDGLEKIITIPVVDESGQPVYDEDGVQLERGFMDYKEWFDYMTQRKSPSVKSMLWNGVTKFFLAVETGHGGVHKDGPRKGEEWKVEEVVTMTDRNLVIMASVANQASEDGKIGEIADYMEVATKGTQEQLIDFAREQGRSNRRTAAIQAYRTFNDNGDQVIVMRTDNKQSKSLELQLGDHAKWNSVNANDLLAMVSEMLDKGATTDDLKEFLQQTK